MRVMQINLWRRGAGGKKLISNPLAAEYFKERVTAGSDRMFVGFVIHSTWQSLSLTALQQSALISSSS